MTNQALKRTPANRLKLIAKHRLAKHGVNLLHSKEEALQRERVRLEGHVTRSEQQWQHACSDATQWLLRSRSLGASAELAAIITSGPEPASVALHWQTAMGVTYPGAIDCIPPPDPVVFSTAALRPTLDASRLALQTGANHAATTEALRRLDMELTSTRRRRRAIEQRLVPRLESSIHDLDLQLDEQDRDEALRVQIAIQKQEVPRS